MRRWPKPGARTATACNAPDCMLWTSMPSALASAVSHRMTSGRAPSLPAALSIGIRSFGCFKRLVGHEDQRVLEDRLHPLLVADHVRREHAVLDDDALDEAHGHAGLVALLDVDDALGADLLQRLGDDDPMPAVLLGGDRRHLDEVRALDRARHALQLRDDLLDTRLDAGAQEHRVRALVEREHAFAHDRLREQRRRRRAVAGLVGRLVGDLADELRAHVLVLVGELDLTRDRHAVVGDRRRSRQALQYDVAPLRAQGHLDRVGQLVHACLQQETSLMIEVEALAHRVSLLLRAGRGCLGPANVRCRDRPSRH